MASQTKVKEIFVTILLMAILIPVAFSMFFSSNTSGWDATTLLVWAVIPVIAIVVVLLKLFDKL